MNKEPEQPKPTPEVALVNLYNATRHAPLTAEQHEFLRQCADLLMPLAKPEVEPAKET